MSTLDLNQVKELLKVLLEELKNHVNVPSPQDLHQRLIRGAHNVEFCDVMRSLQLIYDEHQEDRQFIEKIFEKATDLRDHAFRTGFKYEGR